MSVSGVDLGSQFITIGVVQRRGIEIITNEASNRKTPALVAFNGKKRFLGESAATQQARNVKNTVSYVKRLLGRRFDDAGVAAEIKAAPFSCVEIPDSGEIGVQIRNGSEVVVFSTTQLMGMLLHEVKGITERATGSKNRDVCLSVPAFFTQSQRQALISAAKISQLHVSRLLNEPTAVALSYGFYRQLEFEQMGNSPQKVLFLDFGDTSFQAAVVSFSKGGMKVLSTAWDEDLGGRVFNQQLEAYFAKDFGTRYKIDVASNPRAQLRLAAACEKLRITLSANSEVPMTIESFANDIDVRGIMQRDLYESMLQVYRPRIEGVLGRALESAGVSSTELFAVEVVGGASRTPFFIKCCSAFLGRELSRTLNSEETLAKGCALMATMLSPSYQVGKYEVVDFFPYGIDVSYGEMVSGAPSYASNSVVLLPAGAPLPSIKVLNFPKGRLLALKATYNDPAKTTVYESFIRSFPAGTTPLSCGMKVKYVLSDNGILSLESIKLVEQIVESDSSSSSQPAEGSTSTTPEGGNNEKQEKTEPSAEESKKKMKQKTIDVSVENHTMKLSDAALLVQIEQESKRIEYDQKLKEIHDSRNSLEAYVYKARGALNGEWKSFVTDADKESLLKAARDVEVFLEEEEEEASSKDGYVTRLGAIQALGNPIELRFHEAQYRSEVVDAFKAKCASLRVEVTSPAVEHLPVEDKDKILSKILAAEGHLNPKFEAQKNLPATAVPAFLCADVKQYISNLESFSRPILSKPKPKPTPAPSATPTPTPAEGSSANNSNTTTEPSKEEDVEMKPSSASSSSDEQQKMDVEQ